MIPIWKAKQIKGKVIIQDNDRFEMYLSTLPEDIQIVASKHKKQRSGQQNRYYHSVVVKMISEHTGFSTDETHEILKMKFNSIIIHVKNDEIKIAKSTASLSTTDFIQYISECVKFASFELGLIIPEPNEIDV